MEGVPLEGVIKFDLTWDKGPSPEPGLLVELIAFRDVLHRKYLIAADEDGIGFGNISTRSREGFIISGTQTGPIRGPRQGGSAIRHHRPSSAVVCLKKW